MKSTLIRTVVALVLLSVPLAPAAKVYRCNTDDGKIEYSDKPCGEEIEIQDTTHFGNAPTAVDPVSEPNPNASEPSTADASAEPGANAATGDAPSTPAPDPAPSTRDRDRMAADYDRRLEAFDQRIVDLNQRITEARRDGRSREFLADLNDQKRELREQRSALASEKASALAAFEEGGG